MSWQAAVSLAIDGDAQVEYRCKAGIIHAKQAAQMQSRCCRDCTQHAQFKLTWRPWSAQVGRLASCTATPGQACLVYLGAASDPAKQSHMCRTQKKLQGSSNCATSASWRECFMLLMNMCLSYEAVERHTCLLGLQPFVCRCGLSSPVDRYIALLPSSSSLSSVARFLILLTDRFVTL